MSKGVRLFGGAATNLLANSTPSHKLSLSLKEIFENEFSIINYTS